MTGDESCVCGHVWDEHIAGGHECDVADCECLMWEADE